MCRFVMGEIPLYGDLISMHVMRSDVNAFDQESRSTEAEISSKNERYGYIAQNKLPPPVGPLGPEARSYGKVLWVGGRFL